MKKKLLPIALVFASATSFGMDICYCQEFGQGTLTTVTYAVEGGCCTGIASPGASIHNYVQNQGQTYTLDTVTSMSGDMAQDRCCPNFD